MSKAVNMKELIKKREELYLKFKLDGIKSLGEKEITNLIEFFNIELAYILDTIIEIRETRMHNELDEWLQLYNEEE